MQPACIDLLCVPCAGASATMYLRWRRWLPVWIRVKPVELPGRGSRLAEPPALDFDPLVAQLCDEQASCMRGHYALFGHSMGALLANAMARRQHARSGVLPCALFVSGSAAPSCFDRDRYPAKDDAALTAELRKQGGTPDEVFDSPDLLRIALDTLGADYRLCETFAYDVSQPLPAPIHAFGGRQDEIAAERVEAWREEAGSTFSVDWFDGGHFFVRQHESRVLAAIVRELRDRSSGTGRTAVSTA